MLATKTESRNFEFQGAHVLYLLRKRPSVTSKLSIASSSFALETCCYVTGEEAGRQAGRQAGKRGVVAIMTQHSSSIIAVPRESGPPLGESLGTRQTPYHSDLRCLRVVL